MSVFITNKGDNTLSNRLHRIIPESDELKFLTAFFYFSGIQELYSALKAKPQLTLNVLVGLNVDRTSHGLVEYAEADGANTKNKVQLYFDSVASSLKGEEFDTKDFYEQINFILEQIQTRRIIIRKTLLPNHAKLYIFKIKEGSALNPTYITGSSNLTRPGLRSQQELNLEPGNLGFDEAEAYFDELWRDALKITENDVHLDRLIQLIKQQTHIRTITPFEAYAVVLKSYLESFKPKHTENDFKQLLENGGYSAYNYQIDAAKQALSIIEENNGVLIADVVGLGKSIIASLVASELDGSGMVICPPGLVGSKTDRSGWYEYLINFGLIERGWSAETLGNLSELKKAVKLRPNIKTIIVDEAHRFRNQDTESYQDLQTICRGKRVILLSATPFNNTPGDVLSLAQLFIATKKSRISLSDNLKATFQRYDREFDDLSFIKRYHASKDPKKREEAMRRYKRHIEGPIDLHKLASRTKVLAREIRDVMEPITVRRNRLDLKVDPTYSSEMQELSELAPPLEWLYELTPEQSEFYDKVLEDYFGDPSEGGRFKGAVYKPFEYETTKNEDLNREENVEKISQRNLYDFMRRLLVKRFESSFGAFNETLGRFIGINQKVLEFINNSGGQYVLDRSLIEKFYAEPELIEQRLVEYAEKLERGEYPKSKKVYDTNKFTRKDAFFDDIASDIKLFKEVQKHMQDLGMLTSDPKLNGLIKDMTRFWQEHPPKPGEPKRKIIIFSEYADTVSHIKDKLSAVYRGRVLDVSGSQLTTQTLRSVRQDFDAKNTTPTDSYDVLLTTDRLSEGFNLNRAGLVVNYDIPWNPVRVIQRVGRINRMSKKVFEELYIANFFPTEKGAEHVKSRDIAAAKMFLIHNTLGEDAQIFAADEEPSASALFEKLNANPEEDQDTSLYTEVKSRFYQIKGQYPDLIKEIDSPFYPTRLKVAKQANQNELFVFIKKGRLFVRRYAEGIASEASLSECLDSIACGFDEPTRDLSSHFWPAYERLKNPKIEASNNPSQLSLEAKALNCLKDFESSDQLVEDRPFIQTLIEDIREYGTLADYTLRRIANLDSKSAIEITHVLEELSDELGNDYLENYKSEPGSLNRQTIIAIENLTNV